MHVKQWKDTSRTHRLHVGMLHGHACLRPHMHARPNHSAGKADRCWQMHMHAWLSCSSTYVALLLLTQIIMFASTISSFKPSEWSGQPIAIAWSQFACARERSACTARFGEKRRPTRPRPGYCDITSRDPCCCWKRAHLGRHRFLKMMACEAFSLHYLCCPSVPSWFRW
jgi:hypothetical protein